MFMELLTIVPSVTFTSVLGEFIPFSIGSLAVLSAFNHFTPDMADLRMTSIPPSINTSLTRSLVPTVHSVDLPAVNPPLSPPSPHQTPYSQSIRNHPFAAKSLFHATAQVDNWQLQSMSARSSFSIDSAKANSIKGVVIQVASRASRAPFTRLPQEISPLSSSARSSPLKPIGVGENPDLVRVQPGPQQILPDQAKYAERFEHEPPKKPKPPPILINFNSPALKSWPSGDAITARSPSSAVYGSDIIRVSRQSTTTEATRQTTHSRGATSSSRHSYLTSSPRDTAGSSTARSSRCYSWALPQEEMPVLYEASVEGSSRTNVTPKSRPPTFGETYFQTAPIVPPSRASTSRPLSGPSGPRVRGPRPPPPSPLQADLKYLALDDTGGDTLPMKVDQPHLISQKGFDIRLRF